VTARKRKPAPAEAKTSLEHLQGGINAYAAALETELRTGVSEENDTRAKIAGELVMRLTQIQAEERKAEAERRRMRGQITKDDVLSFLRALTAPEWSEIRREVDAKHSGRSGLA
jgi:hypothetical protein